MSKKRKNKRSKVKHPSLNPGYNLLTRKEYLDYDYLNELSEEELEFLAKFTSEWLNANFSKDDDENILQGKEIKKEVYNRNNARNRCVYSRAKAQNKVDDSDDIRTKSTTNIEDYLIDYIDDKDN